MNEATKEFVVAADPHYPLPPELEPQTALAVVPEITLMTLLDRALQNHAAIDVIERLAALQEKAMNRQDEIDFATAMSAVQAEVVRVAPDLVNKQTSSKYASYAALDHVVRPVYTKHGFSLSFSTEPAPKDETLLVVCYCSRGGYTRKYQVLMPADGKGAKGGDVMTLTHATGAAASYGMRYLLKMIFNIAIGEEDTDGNMTAASLPKFDEYMAAIEMAPSIELLREGFKLAFKEAALAKNLRAQQSLQIAYEKRKKELSDNEPA
jgi:hypothetical protein